MFRKIKITIVFVLTLVLTTTAIKAISTSGEISFNLDDNIANNFPYIEEQLLKSSRFTQKNEYDEERLDNYYDNYQISYDEEKLDVLGFKLVLENDNYELYFENDSYSIVVMNKTTGFIWSSRAEFQAMSDGNNNARNLMNSGIWIDYVNTNNVNYRENNISLYSAAGATYLPVDEVEEEIRPYLINKTSYNKNKVEVVSNITNNTITSKVKFKEQGISFDVLLTLNEDGINVNVINESIVETNDNNKLTGIYVFPYLGSTREDNVPGYFVIPDGVGALVRFDQMYNQNFNARFYGNDLGYSFRYLPNLTIPIYGIVHHEGNNALYANITEGSENTLLQGRFWGTSGRYFRMSQKFVVRNIYTTVIDRQGNGYDSLLNETLNSNYNVQYKFLSDEEASYLGIAKDYQQTLVDEEILTKSELNNNGNIPINTNYLMSDRENTFIGTKKVTMSTTKQVNEMYDFFRINGINNQLITLSGYSTSGNLDRSPYKINLIERNKNFKELTSNIQSNEDLIYLENDYTFSSELNNRISYNNDVARNISKTRMLSTTLNLNGDNYDIYRLYPDRALRFTEKDGKDISELGINGVVLSHDVRTLYSYARGNNYYSRTDSLEHYYDMYESFDSVVMRRPNLYAIKYAKAYLDMPVTNSQYDYYTDLVPLLPIIFKGYLSYFTPDLNFNALGHDRILMMVDFGLNPSYILTFDETYKMRHTLSSVYYSTTFDSYKDEVVETYDYVNNALKHVVGETIVNRTVLDTGVVLISYSNGVEIYVNYSSSAYAHNGNLVAASNYKVVI